MGACSSRGFEIIFFVSNAPPSVARASYDSYPVCIESEGFYPPERLLPEAIQVMRTKIATLRRAAEALLNDTGMSEDAEMAET